MTVPRPPDARSGDAANAGPPLPGASLETLWADIDRKVGHERGVRAWLRSRSTVLRVVLVCGVLAATAAAHLLWGRRSDGFLVSSERLLLTVGSVALAIGLCVRLALAPLTRPLPRATALGSVALLLLPVLAALLPALRVGSGDHHPSAASWAAAAGCFGYGGLVVLGVGAALWCVDRGGASSGARLIPGVVCAGLAAHLVLQIHCANDNSTHLLLGHASVGIAWLAVWVAARGAGRLKARSRPAMHRAVSAPRIAARKCWSTPFRSAMAAATGPSSP